MGKGRGVGLLDEFVSRTAHACGASSGVVLSVNVFSRLYDPA